MTDDILKHIDIGMRCSAFTIPPDVCVPYLKALRAAIKALEVQADYGGRNDEAGVAIKEIAAILGVEVGEK